MIHEGRPYGAMMKMVWRLTGISAVEVTRAGDVVVRMGRETGPDEGLEIEDVQVRDHATLGD